jgi:dTDP-4-dehydrorhamnose 3,5-epimerase-like enzyme
MRRVYRGTLIGKSWNPILKTSTDTTGAVNVEGSDVAGPLLITLCKFADERDFRSETHNGRVPEPPTGTVYLVRENHALSGDKPVRTIRDAAYAMTVDIGTGSNTFGHLATGVGALEPKTGLVCGLAGHYSAGHDSSVYERGLAWDDPSLAIPRPAAGAFILSVRDRGRRTLVRLGTFFRFTGGTSHP